MSDAGCLRSLGAHYARQVFRFGVTTLLLSLGGCEPSPRAPVRARSPAEAAAKWEVLSGFVGHCELEAIKARLPPPPGAEAPPPPPHPEPAAFEPFVFAELAVFVVPSAKLAGVRGRYDEMARDPEVLLLGTPHIAAKPAQAARMSLSEHTGPLASPSLREVVATIAPGEGGKHLVELEITLQLPTPPDSMVVFPPERQVRIVTGPPARAPVFVDGPIPNWPGVSLITVFMLTPVREEADLRALFVCKLERRRAP
jgi:hypothetical protein